MPLLAGPGRSGSAGQTHFSPPVATLVEPARPVFVAAFAVTSATYDAAGSADASSSVSGAVGLIAAAVGATTGTSSAAGSVTVLLPTTGGANGTSNVTGVLAALLPTSGTASGITGTVGTAGATTSAVGAVAGTSTTLGAITARLSTSSAVAGVSGTAGAVGASTPASGAAAAVSTTTGSLTARLVATGTTAGASATVGTPTALLPTTGTTGALSGTVGAATRATATYPTAGTTDATTSANGTATALRPTIGSVVALSGTTGDATRALVTYSATGTTATTSAITGATTTVNPGGSQMAAPATSWNTVRVIGTWHNLDGTMKAGKWTLTYPVRVVNTTNDAIIPAGSTTGDLQTNQSGNPSLDIQVPATDDTDNTPTGWQYRLSVNFTDSSAKETYVLSVPLAGGTIDLATIVLTDTIPTTQDVIVRGVAGGLAEFNNVIVTVVHGSNPNVARPTGATVVAWCGDAEPVNATGYDFRIPATG